MARCQVWLLWFMLAVGNTNAASSLKRKQGISRAHRILGNARKEEIPNIRRAGSKEEIVKDSAEDLRPKDLQHANMGFEQYWHNGEWAHREAAIDYCNTSEADCPFLYKRYGKLCASSIDYEAQHTFKDMCELEDINCRDGSVSLFTTSDDPKNIKWFPVKRNSSMVMKVSAAGWWKVIFARDKDISVLPQLIFAYNPADYCVYAKETVWDGPKTYLGSGFFSGTGGSYQYFVPKDKSLPTTQVRTWQVNYYGNEGFATWTDLDADFSYDLPFQDDHKLERRFPIRYVGVWGGSKNQPHWIELKGYLASYRGHCREDLPTLPPEVPVPIGTRHKIQLFNFAERMDVFGYNYTRIKGALPYEYGLDYFQDYHAQP